MTGRVKEESLRLKQVLSFPEVWADQLGHPLPEDVTGAQGQQGVFTPGKNHL